MSNRSVIFKTLWLVSQRDTSARRLDFHSKTLLLGPNGTGKSRIAKNLYWVFGCDAPKRNMGSWDPKTIGGLEFEFNGKDYLVLRSGPKLGLFSGDELVFASQRRSEWDKFLGGFFGYLLKLSRPGTTKRFDQAGPEYLTLPFYMDQDGSWSASWNTYESLGQFSNWKIPTFEAFIGLRPNAYFDAKQKRDEVAAQLRERQRDLDAQRDAFRRVEDVLPTDVPSLDPKIFRDELAQLGQQAAIAYEQQAKVRGKLLAIVSTREQVRTELQLAGEARRELTADIVYLSELPAGPIECPTCGTEHENSFHARLNLSQDADTMSALVAELQSRAETLRIEETDIRLSLNEIEQTIALYEETATHRKADLALSELLAAQSRKTLDQAFKRVSLDIQAVVTDLESSERELKAKMKLFENKAREKQVREFYLGQLKSLSTTLNVPLDEQMLKFSLGARAQTGGSSAPRSMLATHLALLKTNVEYGDCPVFPFVVDTPQQSGQDEKNLRKMIEVIGKVASIDHQVILAAEFIPDGTDVSIYEIKEFDQSHGALNKDDYPRAVERLRAPYTALNDRIALTGSKKPQRTRREPKGDGGD
ncbi:hypothetical protein [Luteimonas sp. SDU82]|uniref:hypothetical protein n=1 Tax=Luteimonas sp. SDU82 TaxID=3422592 RepID=UPI003EBC9E8D